MLLRISGIGGAESGVDILAESPWRDLGRRMVDALRSLFGGAKFDDGSRGAVWGVMGVKGVDGVAGTLPLMRESYGFFDGVIAILAKESFMDMERNRLCVAGFLMMGDAALVVEFSYGSELRKEREGEDGVGGANCDCRYDDCESGGLLRSRREAEGT